MKGGTMKATIKITAPTTGEVVTHETTTGHLHL